MKAARLYGVADVRVAEEARPEAGDGESLVQVRAVGLCGSDLHWFTDGGIGDAVIGEPLVPGHEVAGIALDGPHAGRVVAVDPAIPCEHCERCREGNPNLCPQVKFSGHGSLDGGVREVMAWPTDRLFPLPEGVTPDEGALLEPLGVAIHSWDLGHARLGDTVSVVGAGPIGLLLIQLALSAGHAVDTVVEPLPHRRAAASQPGVERVVAPGEPLAAETDVVFEVSGKPDAVREAMELARPGGRVVLVGIPDDDTTTFPAALARRKGLTIAVVRRMPDVYPRAIDLLARGRVDLAPLVSKRFGIDDAADAFRHAADRSGLKIIIDPGM